MKTLLRTILLTSLIGLLVNCNKEEVTSRDYPRLKTLPVSEINAEGARFNAEIIFRGGIDIVNYGFAWGEFPNPSIQTSDRVIYSENMQSNNFSETIETTLKEGATYYVRAYVETNDFIVYGENVDFISLGSKAPKIKDISPKAGTIGDSILIKGTGFSYLNATNNVYFNGIEANVVSSTDSLVIIVVPLINNTIGNISLSILGNTSSYDGSFDITKPDIQNLFPLKAAIDDTLTITGENFSHRSLSNILEIGGVKCSIISSNKKVIKAIVPSGLSKFNQFSLTIAGQKDSIDMQFEFLLPEIISLNKTNVTFGEDVTIHGQNFSDIPKNNLILLNGIEAEILSATKEDILFTIPNELSKAQNTLTLKVAGRALNYESINLKPPVLQSIDPSLIVDYENGNLIISGENFNPIKGKNSVQLGNRSATIVSSSKNELIVNFPRLLIPEVELSVMDTLDITVTVLDQNARLENYLILDYKSTWTRLNNFESPYRTSAISASINGIGYIGLGTSDRRIPEYYLSDLWSYDPINDTWKELSPFPSSGRVDFGTFVLNQNIYIIGGTIGSGGSWDAAVKEVWKFDPSANSWNRMADFPGEPRDNAIFFSINGFGYYGGGKQGSLVNGRQLFSDFWRYDPSLDSWTQLNNISPNTLNSTNSYGPQLNTNSNSKGYISNSDGEFWQYSPESDNWTQLKNNYGGRSYGLLFSIDNNIYSIQTSRAVSNFHKYSINEDKWTENYQPKYMGISGCGFNIDNVTYIFAGEDKSFWKFDPSKPE